ncbi:MAG: hypothetical protein AB7L66_12355 [Gemmatimonadales bacterium]
MLMRSALIVAQVGLVAMPAASRAQDRNRVSYDVEFRVEGSALDRNCAAAGTDVLTGTLVGLEPAPSNEGNEYVGTLKRITRITTCGSRTTAAGHDVVCTLTYDGQGWADVILTLGDDRRGGWLQYLTSRTDWAHLLPPARLQLTGETVTGTCDPTEMAQLEDEYHGGQTAGSPNGQPIEMTAFPTSGLPAAFPARPPESVWTLRVLARRP